MSYQLKRLFIIIPILLLLNSRCLFGNSNEVQKITQAIKAKRAKWSAGESWITRLSAEEQAQLLGTNIEFDEVDRTRFIHLPQITNLPEHFDWRDNNGNWVTPPRHQYACGSCWAFGPVAQVEAWWKIQNGDPDTDFDLSEQYLLSCSDAGDCDGGSPTRVLEFIRTHGIPPERCLPYEASATVPCDAASEDADDNLVTIPGWGYITLEEAEVEYIKLALLRQPVCIHFNLYQDFGYYKSGVYEHVWGEQRGTHLVIIVGWDDNNECWICKNSWGEDWGEKGFFRIKWGILDMGMKARFIWDDTTSTPALQLEPAEFHFSLDHGDSTTGSFSILNSGIELLEYAAMDYEIPVLFHPTQFNSYDSSSWWCGDNRIGGYGQRWLQYLDTPALDLSQTSAPKLSFMAFWALQPPDSAKAPWDGFDGCNVWISTDSGESFSVVYPEMPDYTCQSLLSFGKAGEGWGLGEGIAGWSGFSGGWVPITFDLQNYRSEQVVVRFAFASDYEIHTRDDTSFIGFFIDEINISAGDSILFEDHGENGQTMRLTGFGQTVADWLHVSEVNSVLQPQESAKIGFQIGGGNIDPRLYTGGIRINTNSQNQLIPFTLEVKPVDQEVGLGEVNFNHNCQYNQILPELRIYNFGKTEVQNVKLLFSLADSQGNTKWTENREVETLQAGRWRDIALGPIDDVQFNLHYTGNIDLEIPGMDKIEFNNQQQFTYIPKLIETFKEPKIALANWDLRGGWGIVELKTMSTVFDYYDGNVACNLAPGNGAVSAIRTMTLKYPINLENHASAKIEFILMHEFIGNSVASKFNLQVSTDSLIWENLKLKNTYRKRFEACLDPYLQLNIPEVWVRFYFQTAQPIENMLYYVDDICLYTKVKSEIDIAAGFEPRFQLSRNYPNPFNSITQIEYKLPEPARIDLKIFNVKGQIVRHLMHEKRSAGIYTTDWDGRDDRCISMPSGLYFIRLDIENRGEVKTEKMVLLK